MEAYQALERRRSTRWFLDRPVAIEDLKKIAELGLRSPSWVNSQPYHAHIVTGSTLAKIKEEFLAASQAGKASQPELAAIPRKDWSQDAQEHMAHWQAGVKTTLGDMEPLQEAAIHLYNAPAVVYLTLPKGYSPWSLYDLGGFGMGMIIAATERGIASLPAYRFVVYPDIIRKYVTIPEDEVLILGIGLGYRDPSAVVNRITAPRKPLTELLDYKE